MRVWKATMPAAIPPVRCVLGSRQVRLMVKKRISRGILEFCWVCDHARSGFAREVRLETKKVHFMVKKAE